MTGSAIGGGLAIVFLADSVSGHSSDRWEHGAVYDVKEWIEA